MQQEDASSEYDDKTSSDSSPDKSPPFAPLFTAEVVSADKDGESIKFTIMAKRFNEVTGVIVNRIYEDFEYLHHCLTTQNSIDGVIVPPLPDRTDLDPKSAENKSKQQLGNDTKVLQPDDFSQDCHNLQGYLRMVLNHPAFGNHSALDIFLSQTEAPVRSHVKKGLFNKLTDVVDEVRKGNHRDIDEYFQSTRDWATEYCKVLKEISINCNSVISSQHRLSTSHSSLAAMLTISDGYKDTQSFEAYKVLVSLSTALDQIRAGLDRCSSNDEKTVGNLLNYYTKYLESVKSMLFRRTCLLLQYEEANKYLIKAKPIKRQAAEEAQVEAERNFDKCSDIARNELKTFLQQRIMKFGEVLTQFTELQIQSSQDTYSALNKTLTTLKQLDT